MYKGANIAPDITFCDTDTAQHSPVTSACVLTRLAYTCAQTAAWTSRSSRLPQHTQDHLYMVLSRYASTIYVSVRLDMHLRSAATLTAKFSTEALQNYTEQASLLPAYYLMPAHSHSHTLWSGFAALLQCLLLTVLHIILSARFPSPLPPNLVFTDVTWYLGSLALHM